MGEYYQRHVTDEERRDFLRALGVTGAVAAGGTALGDVTLEDLRGAIDAEPTDELAAMGESIRSDLTGDLDADLLGTGMAGLAGSIERVPSLHGIGAPEPGETPYHDLVAPGWTIEEHLADVGFFASAETNLPVFNREHIVSVTKELIRTDSLAATLSDVGFDGRERTALVMNVINNDEMLDYWAPTRLYEDRDVEGVVSDYVPPLHRRAAGGSLLWIQGLDKHLWQNDVLITDRMHRLALWDVKAMLGGLHLLANAADGIARGRISDEEFTALVTGATAVMILGQFDFMNDIVRITDDERAPIGGV